MGYAEGASGPLAVRLERPRLEELLVCEAEDAGARVELGARVEAAAPDGRVVVRGAAGARRHEWLVAADGAAAPVSGRLLGRGRCASSALIGVEARVVLDRRLPCDEFYTIHGYRYAPGFFAWVVPVSGGREALVGLASRRRPLRALELLLHDLDSTLGVSGASGLRSGLVLRGPPPRSPARGRLVGVGDSVCTSKPFTGGGLYAVSLLAPRLGEALTGGGLGDYLEAYRALREELLLQRILSSAALVAKPILHAVQALMGAGCRVDYDRHSTVLRCLL